MRILMSEIYDGHIIEVQNNSTKCFLCIDGIIQSQYKGIFAFKIEMKAYVDDVEIKLIVKFGAHLSLYANDKLLKKKFIL